MAQQDDTCYIPRIRRHKIPTIYPLVAAPTMDHYTCCQSPSGSESSTPVSENEGPPRNPRWNVVRVSRTNGTCSEPEEKFDRSMKPRPEEVSELKTIQLLMNLPSAKKEKEVVQSKRKLPRISHRKLRPSDKLHPMMRIPEEEETI
ncbi:hypothetical protein OESDEN_09514, partial [Oesophagostomum dentatum]